MAVIVGAHPSAVVGNPISRMGGGRLRRLINITNTRLWVMFQGGVVLYCCVIVSGIQRTTYPPYTYILRLYPTEIRRSLQSLHLLVPYAAVPQQPSRLPDSSYRTLQAFHH